MTLSQRRTAFTFGLFLLSFGIAFLAGTQSPGCRSGCLMETPLISSLVAGVALFALVLYSLKFVNARIDSPEGVLLILLLLFNPVIGHFGTGAINGADLAGTALTTGILFLTIRNDNAPEDDLLTGILLTGVLIGLAPSFFPLVILPLLIAFGRSRRKGTAILIFVAGIAVWLVPHIIRSGSEFRMESMGNGIAAYLTGITETMYGFPGIEEKRILFLQNLLTHGLGGYNGGENVLPWLVLFGLLLCFARGAWWMFHRETDGLVITVACITIYIGSLLLQPNNIGQERHLLPLLPIILFPVWGGAVRLMKENQQGRLAVILFLTAYVLAGQLAVRG